MSVSKIREVKFDEALQTKEEKWFYIQSLDGHVLVRKLNFSDLGIIYSKAKDDPFEMAKCMIVSGIVKPKWTSGQVAEMKPNVATELATVVADYSGMTPEALERTRNLSRRIPGAMPSGT